MPSNGRSLYVDSLLTNMSIGYRNAMYIADNLFPIVTVQKQSGIIPGYNQSSWFRNQARRRAPGTKSSRSGWKTDLSALYYCQRVSHGHEIPDEDRDNVAEPFDLDRDGTDFVTDKIQMSREVSFATDFFKTGVWSADHTGGTDFTPWSDYGGSTPLLDIEMDKDEIEGQIAREPNKLTIGKQVWTKLKWHPTVIDTIKHTQTAMMTRDLFKALVELEEICIGRAIFTDDPEGTAESDVRYKRIWGKHALTLYVPSRPSLMNPSAGYTYIWNRAGIQNALQYIKRMRDEEREIDIIEANSYFAHKLTGARAGSFRENVVA